MGRSLPQSIGKNSVESLFHSSQADKQSEIRQKVMESFNFRKHAKDLLEHAKRAVEIAIEQDERTAIDWLGSVSQVADA